MKTVKIKIEGMSGLDCAVHLLRTLSAVPTVNGLGVTIGEATVEYEIATDEQLLGAIRMAGNYRGEIMTVPATGMISKVEIWTQKVKKISAIKKNLDSVILPGSDLPPFHSLRTKLP